MELHGCHDDLQGTGPCQTLEALGSLQLCETTYGWSLKPQVDERVITRLCGASVEESLSEKGLDGNDEIVLGGRDPY